MDQADFIFRLFSGEIDRRKIAAVLVAAILAFSGLMVYEGITAAFTLNRLQNSADLISKLQEIQREIRTNSSPAIISAYKEIERQSSEVINLAPLPIEISAYLGKVAGKDFVAKFFWGSAVVWVFGIWATIRTIYKPTPLGNKEKILFWIVAKNIIYLGFLYGLFAVWMPKVFWLFGCWQLFHAVGYFILSTFIFCIITAMFVKPETDLAADNQAANKSE